MLKYQRDPEGKGFTYQEREHRGRRIGLNLSNGPGDVFPAPALATGQPVMTCGQVSEESLELFIRRAE